MSKPYKLPKCWLGKSRQILSDKEQVVNEVITEDMVNMDCRCTNEMQAFFCDDGHLTECHVGMSCEEAECSHYERENPYATDPDDDYFGEVEYPEDD